MTQPAAPSAIYAGRIRHRRFAPTVNTFDYPLYMLYLDLDGIQTVFSPYRLWSYNRANLNSFHRADYHGPPDLPLKRAVLNTVEAQTGQRPDGPVRLLTHVRTLGLVFNPVSFYYCFDQHERLRAIAAEITNTPWLERYTYVLPVDPHHQRTHRFAFDKRFHVSPFMPMEQRYHWAFNTPGQRLAIHMSNTDLPHSVDPDRPPESARPSGPLQPPSPLQPPKRFDATLRLRRRPLNRRMLNKVIAQYPAMTAQVVARIYWQALKLKLKKTPFHPHPTPPAQRIAQRGLTKTRAAKV